jgi:hypothetical protein
MYDSYDSEDGSFVKIETSVVREACQKTIASITTYRQKSDDRQIADAVASNATYHKYFWWLGVRLESREEIVKVLNWRVVFFPSIYPMGARKPLPSVLGRLAL